MFTCIGCWWFLNRWMLLFMQSRLYTQLEVLKNKTLRQDNPHISKRRGGRKPAHRRFSLQVLSWLFICKPVLFMRLWECVLWMMPCDRIHAKKQTFQEKNSKFSGLIFHWKKKRRKIVDKFNGCAKCNQLFCVVHGAYGNFGINGWIDKTVFSVHSWKIHSTFVFCCYCVLVNCIISYECVCKNK